jgi:hypothetical protein
MPTSTARSRPVLLAVDQQFAEGPGLRVPPEGADRVGSVEVGEAQDVDELGAGRWRARFQPASASAITSAMNS